VNLRIAVLMLAAGLAFLTFPDSAGASGMKRYVMVLLWRGEQTQERSPEELAEIQRGHMATINRLAAEKKLVIAGPFGDDGDLRGIFILDVETIEEAEALVAGDPAVMAGRLRAEFKPWWGSDRLPELLEPRAEP
jgi:uncharacterized protein